MLSTKTFRRVPHNLSRSYNTVIERPTNFAPVNMDTTMVINFL